MHILPNSQPTKTKFSETHNGYLTNDEHKRHLGIIYISCMYHKDPNYICGQCANSDTDLRNYMLETDTGFSDFAYKQFNH